MSQEISTQSAIIEATPTIQASAYASGDQLGSLFTLANVAQKVGEAATIMDIVVVDKGKQSAAFDILFFDASPTVASSDNGAIDISDAEMADKFLGRVSVAADNYTALANSSEATVRNVGLSLKPTGTSKDCYGLLVSRGTPTYVSTSDLVLKIKVLQD